jgi:dTDP-4-amino-4,6-dideoxygalactose transaminase
MDMLADIARRHGLHILEDAAQGLGSQFRGRSAGTFGMASAISFYPAKVLGCFGDGGAVLTNDRGVFDKICQLRDHGRNADGKVVSWGMNSRLDNLQAAFLNFELRHYGDVISRRRALARLYSEQLGDVREIALPPAPDSDPDHFDIYQNYEIEADNRDALKAHLADNGVGTLIQWGGQAVHQIRELGFTIELPRTDRLFTRLLMLPMNVSLSDEDVQYVCRSVRDFYGYRTHSAWAG